MQITVSPNAKILTATAAGKAPSAKAVQKAQSVLKSNQKARIEKIRAEGEKPLAALVEADKAYVAADNADKAKIKKLNAEIDAIKINQRKREDKWHESIKRNVARITKVRQKLVDLGTDLKIPTSIEEYLPAVHATGSKFGPVKGVKPLKEDGPKIGEKGFKPRTESQRTEHGHLRRIAAKKAKKAKRPKA